MRPFFKIEGNFCSLMYSFKPIVRCGTISVIPSSKAQAGIEHGPRGLLIFKDFTASKTSLMVVGRKLNTLGVVLISILFGNFSRSNHLGVRKYSSVGSQSFCHR